MDQDRIRQLEERIRQNERCLRDPYEQNKWVEREQIERDRNEIERLRNE